MQGRWLSVRAAAKDLAITPRSVRRRIEAGQYRSRIHGRLTEVWLGEGDPEPSTSFPGAPKRTSQEDASAAVTDDEDEEDAQGDVHPAEGDVPLGAWQSLLTLFDKERDARSAAEQAAAMWQERARNLEAHVEQLLALPMHEEEAGPRRRWWRFWQ